VLVRLHEAARAHLAYRGDHGAHRVACFLLHGSVFVQRIVAVVVGSEVAYVAIELRKAPGGNQSHPVEPIAQISPLVLNACDITVHDHTVDAAR